MSISSAKCTVGLMGTLDWRWANVAEFLRIHNAMLQTALMEKKPLTGTCDSQEGRLLALSFGFKHPNT